MEFCYSICIYWTCCWGERATFEVDRLGWFEDIHEGGEAYWMFWLLVKLSWGTTFDSFDSSGASVSAIYCWTWGMLGWVAGRQMVFLFTFLIGNFLRIRALNWRLISAWLRFLLESVMNQFSWSSSLDVILASQFTLSISFRRLRQSSERSLLISLNMPL